MVLTCFGMIAITSYANYPYKLYLNARASLISMVPYITGKVSQSQNRPGNTEILETILIVLTI